MYTVIFGLCNPGRQYNKTWHSIGAECLKILAQNQQWNFEENKEYYIYQHEKNIYLYSNNLNINESGKLLMLLHKKYRFNIENVIVLHDEVMLKHGVIKITQSGSAKGHNGLRNIITFFGANFHRIKIGVDHPGKEHDLSKYLLTQVIDEQWNGVIKHFNQHITVNILENISQYLDNKF